MLPEHMGMRTTAYVMRGIAYAMRGLAYVILGIAYYAVHIQMYMRHRLTGVRCIVRGYVGAGIRVCGGGHMGMRWRSYEYAGVGVRT